MFSKCCQGTSRLDALYCRVQEVCCGGCFDFRGHLNSILCGGWEQLELDRRFHPPNGAGMGTVTPASGNGIDVSKGGPLIRQ